MRTHKPARQSFPALLLETARESVSDFVCGGLPVLAALGGILAVVLVPLLLIARGAGLL